MKVLIISASIPGEKKGMTRTVLYSTLPKLEAATANRIKVIICAHKLKWTFWYSFGGRKEKLFLPSNTSFKFGSQLLV